MSIFFPEVPHTSYLTLHSEEKHLNKLINSSSKACRVFLQRQCKQLILIKLLTTKRGIQEKDYNQFY